MKNILLTILLLSPYFIHAQEFVPLSFIQKQHDQQSDSLIAQQVLDSLQAGLPRMNEEGLSYQSVSVHASKDSLLKIYQIIGEGCGAYCNPFYEYVVAIRSSINQSFTFQAGDQELQFDVDTIYSLVSGSLYLILGEHSGRTRSIEGQWGESAGLYSIEKGFEEVWSFRVSTSNLTRHDYPVADLIFDPETQTLSYTCDSYTDDWDDFEEFRLTGKWKFNGSTFEKVEASKVYYPKE